MRHAFDSCNFSLILRGRGEYHRKGRVWPVLAPCVLTQWPGEWVEYGPSPPQETWTELYFIYPKSSFKRFKTAHLIDPEKPIWPITDVGALMEPIRELVRLTHHPEPDRVADRLDRVAERILLETWLTPPTKELEDESIQTIAALLHSTPGKDWNLDRLAASHGLSVSTFRRRWMTTMHEPPARYLQKLRMREACRLLAESLIPIHEIATATGFEDEFYFSRRFRLEHGMPPREYRKAYRLDRRIQSIFPPK